MTAASAQLNLNAVQSAKDPLTGLGPEQWVQMATEVVNGLSVVGKPEVFMLNATGRAISNVVCDGKWQLVGTKPYIGGAPASLPAWKVTLVPTKGFDGHCKQSIVGQSDNGTVYKASLVSSDGTFMNATFITFQKAN
jgi:hypothetical protein